VELGQRYYWSGVIRDAALCHADVGLHLGGAGAMSKPYKLHAMPRHGNWVRVEIVAETEAGKQRGISDFKNEWLVYDAMVEYETGTTAVMRRYYKQ